MGMRILAWSIITRGCVRRRGETPSLHPKNDRWKKTIF